MKNKRLKRGGGFPSKHPLAPVAAPAPEAPPGPATVCAAASGHEAAPGPATVCAVGPRPPGANWAPGRRTPAAGRSRTPAPGCGWWRPSPLTTHIGYF